MKANSITIKHIRKMLNISQHQLGGMLSKHQSYISLIEANDFSYPDNEYVLLYAIFKRRLQLNILACKELITDLDKSL